MLTLNIKYKDQFHTVQCSSSETIGGLKKELKKLSNIYDYGS